jgi:hypothetical protein
VARSDDGVGTGGDSPDTEGLNLGTYGYILAQARRNAIRTGATVVAVAVAVAFLVVVTSLSVGLTGATERELLDYTQGTPELPIADFIQTEEGEFAGLFATSLLDPEEVEAMRQEAQRIAGPASDVKVYPYSERVLNRTTIYGFSQQVRRLIALDPELGLTTAYTKYHPYLHLVQGDHLGPGPEPAVVLGYRLWDEELGGPRVGNLITLKPRNATWYESPAAELRSGGDITLNVLRSLEGVRVVGVLDHNTATDYNAYVTLEYFAEVTGAGASGVGPRCEAVSVEVGAGGVDMEALGAALAAKTSRVTSYYVTSVGEGEATTLGEGLRSSIYSWLVMAVVIILVAMVLGISNTIFLSVNQRRREIGTLRALGHTRREVVKLVLFEALFLVLMGWAIGFFAGHILTSNVLGTLYEIEGIGLLLAPGRTVLSIVIGSIVAVLLAAFVGAIIPARRAASMHPSDALAP